MGNLVLQCLGKVNIGRDERKPVEVAAFISLVNNIAPGTAREKETHLPTRRWSVLTETTDRVKI